MAKLQVALDLMNLDAALLIAKAAIDGGIDIVEAGTPLIKSEGMAAVRKLCELIQKNNDTDGGTSRVQLVADTKTMDAGFLEARMVFEAGADIVCVLACARDETIIAAKRAAEEFKGECKRVAVDLIGVVGDPIARAIECEKLGADIVIFHTGLDTQSTESTQFEEASAAGRRLNIPVAIAGGINLNTIKRAASCGAEMIIIGAAITRAQNVKKTVEEFKDATLQQKE